VIGGQVVATTTIDGEGNRKTQRFNAQRLVTHTIKSDGSGAKQQIDGNGRVTQRTDALGRTTRYSYDTKGNMICSVDPSGWIVVIDYHGTWGKPIQITRMLENGSQVINQSNMTVPPATSSVQQTLLGTPRFTTITPQVSLHP
jgi:YD repeat-containing protein